MKLKNIFKFASIAVASASLLGVTSCNYLDVVPPEQAGLPDAMKTNATALGFLHSCYNGLTHREMSPTDYRSCINATTDEYVIPNDWYAGDGASAYAAIRNTQNSGNIATAPGFWSTFYQMIGQTLLFERELDGEGAKNEVWNSQDQYDEWKAESRFMRAYYHFQLLRIYGPIPITDHLVSSSATISDYPARTHFDGCVNWIVNELDECIKVFDRLGIQTRPTNEFGRATSVIAKAIKARVLLYAASDLYNGGFPSQYNSWRKGNKVNTVDPVTGKEYGRELISGEFDPAKWTRAYTACVEALDAAQKAGFKLFDRTDAETAPIDQDVVPSDMWVPDEANLIAEMNKLGDVFPGTGRFDIDAFKRAMYNYRYLAASNPNEGNTELIWGNCSPIGGYQQVYGRYKSRIPKRVFKNESNGQEADNWGGVSPTLYTVEHFLCADGSLPAQDKFYAQSQFYTEAGITESGKNGKERSRIPTIATYREPRFYAYIGFDGGDYLTQICDGKPLVLNLRDPNKQGFKTGERNYCVTGFLSMKHVGPVWKYNSTLNETTGGDNPEMFVRLAELYLNIAECAAEMAKHQIALPDGKDAVTVALENVNVIRDRAYVPELTRAQLGTTVVENSGSNESVTYDLVRWVRNERFVELWDEGHRYFDVRRWVAGPEYFGYGKRRGLNGMQFGTKTLTTEEFLKPLMINSQYTFHPRQYLYPIHTDQVYANPQMVQNPGF